MKKLLTLFSLISLSFNSFAYLVLTPSTEILGTTTKFHISFKESIPCLVFPKTKIKVIQMFGSNGKSFGGESNGFTYSVTVTDGICEGFIINQIEESLISFD